MRAMRGAVSRAGVAEGFSSRREGNGVSFRGVVLVLTVASPLFVSGANAPGVQCLGDPAARVALAFATAECVVQAAPIIGSRCCEGCFDAWVSWHGQNRSRGEQRAATLRVKRSKPSGYCWEAKFSVDLRAHHKQLSCS
jgi:hypothetical protein